MITVYVDGKPVYTVTEFRLDEEELGDGDRATVRSRPRPSAEQQLTRTFA
jgi:hypothetical protein